MRIAFSGTANTGKTTLLKNFLAVWQQYSTPTKTYRDIIKENNFNHSSQTTVEAQSKILDFMIDQLQATSKGDKVVFDRCPLDNLAYSLWAHANNIEGFDKKYIDSIITLTRESLRHLDTLRVSNVVIKNRQVAVFLPAVSWQFNEVTNAPLDFSTAKINPSKQAFKC
jgi:hypothetical protein